MTRLESGKEIEYVTKDELIQLLNKYFINYGKGVKYRRIIESYPVLNDEILTSGLGPPDGFSWLIKYTQSDFSGAAVAGNLQWFASNEQGVNVMTSAPNNQNAIPDPGAQLLSEAVLWYDAAQSNDTATIPNLGTGGSALDGTITGLGTDIVWLEHTGENYIWQPPSTGSITSSTSGTLSNTEFDVRAEITSDSWKNMAAWQTFVNSDLWSLNTYPDGGVFWSMSNLAFVNHDYVFGAKPNLSNGDRGWIRCTGTHDGTDWTVSAYDSPDGITWTQIGTTQVYTDTPIYVYYTALKSGYFVWGCPARKIHNFTYREVIDGPVVIDIDCSVVNGDTETFSAVTGETITVNRATTGLKMTCVDKNVWTVKDSGVISVADNSLLNFDATESMSTVIVGRIWVGNDDYVSLLNKQDSGTSTGYATFIKVVDNDLFLFVEDGSTTISHDDVLTFGELSTIGSVVDRTTEEYTASVNGVSLEGPFSTATLLSLENTDPFEIGSNARFEFFGAAVKRGVWTLDELAQIATYYETGPIGVDAVPANVDLEIILHPGEKIVPVLQDAEQGNRTTIIVSLGVIEVPWNMEPKLMGGRNE